MRFSPAWGVLWLLLPAVVLAEGVLKTDGFSTCLDDADIKVEKLDIQFDQASTELKFDVSGVSKKEQNVTAKLIINAVGNEFVREFDPCDEDSKVEQLCPGEYIILMSLPVYRSDRLLRDTCRSNVVEGKRYSC